MNVSRSSHSLRCRRYTHFPMIQVLGTALAALFGLCFGSFLNVCASRWPAGESIVQPASHCRGCGRALLWWENVPLLSWLALRGRCRTCHAPIGWRYPLVEMALAATWACAVWQAIPGIFAPGATRLTLFDAAVFALVKMALCWLLVCMAVLDAEHFWLPDWLTLGGAALGLLLTLLRFAVEWIWVSLPLHWSFESGLGNRRTHLFDTAVFWFLGLLTIPGLILLVRWTYKSLRGHEGMGLGDAKLMLMLAAWLGLSRTLLAFFLGVVLGAVAGVVVLLKPAHGETQNRALTRLPFGAFLCAGGVVAALWGGRIVAAYLAWCGF